MALHRASGHAASRSLPVASCVAILLAAGAPAAGGAAYEPFDYAPGAPVEQWKGGSGFEPDPSFGGWEVGNGGPIAIAAGSLRDPTGTLATSGNHLVGTNSIAQRYLPFSDATAGWVSFLMQAEYDEDADGGIAGLTLRGTDAVYIGVGWGEFGGGEAVIGGNPSQYVRSGVAVPRNTPVFLVAHFASDPSNPYVTLYVNPTPGVLPTGGTRFDGAGWGGRYNHDRGVQVSMKFPEGFGPPLQQARARFDELRIGDTYFDVAPVPEPTAAAAPGAAAALLLARRRRS